MKMFEHSTICWRQLASRSSHKQPPRELAEKWSQLKSWSPTRMGSCKGWHDETIEWSLTRAFSVKLMVTKSFVVIMLNSFYYLSQTEVRVGTSQRTISTCDVLLDLNKNRLLLLNCWLSGRLRELKNKGKCPLVIHKHSPGRLLEWSLTRAFHYRV